MKDEFGLYDDDLELSEIDFSDGDFDVNWFSKVNDNESKNILKKGTLLGKFDDTGATWWSVIKLDEQYFVSLADLDDILEVNKTILDRL